MALGDVTTQGDHLPGGKELDLAEKGGLGARDLWGVYMCVSVTMCVSVSLSGCVYISVSVCVCMCICECICVYLCVCGCGYLGV